MASCRAEGFCIWRTLSEPVQVRIGILNQLDTDAITGIVSRFADAMHKFGATFDKDAVMAGLDAFYREQAKGAA